MDVQTDILMLFEMISAKTLAEQLFTVKEVRFNNQNCYAIKH